jgi:hypothetical protein
MPSLIYQYVINLCLPIRRGPSVVMNVTPTLNNGQRPHSGLVVTDGMYLRKWIPTLRSHMLTAYSGMKMQ